jgi:hypothetical protein
VGVCVDAYVSARVSVIGAERCVCVRVCSRTELFRGNGNTNSKVTLTATSFVLLVDTSRWRL